MTYDEWKDQHVANGGGYEQIVKNFINNINDEGKWKSVMTFFEIKKEKHEP